MNTSKTFSNTMPWTNTQVRNGDFPLERYSIFENLDEAKKYAAGISPYVGLAYEGQLIAVTNSGEQQLYVLDSALSSSEMSGLRRIANYGELSTAQSSLISTINEVSTTICTKLSTDQVLIRDHLSFGYDNDLKAISLSIADISGNVYSSSIKTAQFADDFVLSCARIETHDSQNYIVIYWITEDSSESKTEIPLSAVSQVYKTGYGISVTSEPTTDLDGAGLSYKISIANDIANQTNIVYLSNAISSKVYTGTIAHGEQSGNYSNLSVVKITKEEYEQKIADAAYSGVDLSNNVLYIISSDYIDAYEQRIENVVMSNDNIPSEATNKHYVDSIINELSNTLTDDINTISIQLSTELTTLISSVSSTISTELTTDICSISTELTTLISSVSSTISTELTTLISSVSSTISTELTTLISSVSSTISTELTTDICSISTYLSNAISSKIFIGTELCGGNYTDLSVIKITKEEYDQKVVDATVTGVDLSNNVLYIISSDYIDAYEQCISNLVMTNDAVPSEATNKHYVDILSSNLVHDINQLSIKLSNDYALTSTLSGISAELSNSISSKIHYDNLVTNESADIDLSIVKLSPEQFEQQVLNNQLNDHAFYVLSANHLDAFGKRIENMTMTDDDVPSEAVNKHYVDNLSFHISGDASELIRQVSVQLSNQLYSSLSNNCQIVSALSDADTSNANVGDVAIVSTYISLSGDKPISRTSYYWNGSNWAAMDGNYDATHIYFSEDLMYTNAIGALPAPSGGQGEISANGVNLKQVLESILVKEKSGTKTNPSATTTKTTTNVLYGTKLTPSYNFTFDDGNYQYGPDPTGSKVISWKVKTNGHELELPPTAISANSISNSDAACDPSSLCATFSSNTLTASIYQISAFVNYTDGDIPYTNIHKPDSQASARIDTSYATKQLYLYNVYKPCFWKITTTPTANITSAAISSLSPQTGSNMNVWNVLSNGTWKTSYNCTSPWYEIFFLAPKGIAGHSAWTGKDANNMTVKVETPIDVAFKHENVGNDNYTLFIVRNADIYGATTVTMTFN